MSTHHISQTIRGDGLPIVMIHGYTVDHRVLLPLEPVFDSHPGYRRIYLDLPGHGDSPRLPEPTSASTLTEAVIEWIANVVGDQPFAVLGQSFGGQIARAVTARFGTQVLGSALLVPVVCWGEGRTLPTETVVERDDVFLAGRPPAERELFAQVATRLDGRDGTVSRSTCCRDGAHTIGTLPPNSRPTFFFLTGRSRKPRRTAAPTCSSLAARTHSWDGRINCPCFSTTRT